MKARAKPTSSPQPKRVKHYRVFDTSVGNGLPGKTFTVIQSVDMYLRQVLSYLVDAPFFDTYVLSRIQRYRRYEDRESVTQAYLRFMCCPTEDRMYFVLNMRFLTRTALFSFLESASSDAKAYLSIDRKHMDDLTQDQLRFMATMQVNYGPNIIAILRNILEAHANIKRIFNSLNSHYLRYAVGMLMSNRRGDKYPDHLKTDAWMAISNTIDSYKPDTWKVSFHNWLSYYVKSQKNEIIKFETWELETGDIINLGSMEDDNSGEDVKISASQIQHDMEASLHALQVDTERGIIIDALVSALPRSLKTCTCLQFGFTEPFSLEEEVKMLQTGGE